MTKILGISKISKKKKIPDLAHMGISKALILGTIDGK